MTKTPSAYGCHLRMFASHTSERLRRAQRQVSSSPANTLQLSRHGNGGIAEAIPPPLVVPLAVRRVVGLDDLLLDPTTGVDLHALCLSPRADLRDVIPSGGALPAC